LEFDEVFNKPLYFKKKVKMGKMKLEFKKAKYIKKWKGKNGRWMYMYPGDIVPEKKKVTKEVTKRKVKTIETPYMTKEEMATTCSKEDIQELIKVGKDLKTIEKESDEERAYVKKWGKNQRIMFRAIERWTKEGYKRVRKAENDIYEGLSLGVDKKRLLTNMDWNALKDLKILRSFIENAPKYKGTINRGTKKAVNLKVGETYGLRAMASFGKGNKPIRLYEGRTIFIVKNSKGVDISGLSYFRPGPEEGRLTGLVESEILVPKGNYKVVKKVVNEHKKLAIYMKPVKQSIYYLEEVNA